jgi:hypothetical protein
LFQTTSYDAVAQQSFAERTKGSASGLGQSVAIVGTL